MDQHKSGDVGSENGSKQGNAHLDEEEVGGGGGSRRSGSLGRRARRWGRVMQIVGMDSEFKFDQRGTNDDGCVAFAGTGLRMLYFTAVNG